MAQLMWMGEYSGLLIDPTNDQDSDTESISSAWYWIQRGPNLVPSAANSIYNDSSSERSQSSSFGDYDNDPPPPYTVEDPREGPENFEPPTDPYSSQPCLCTIEEEPEDETISQLLAFLEDSSSDCGSTQASRSSIGAKENHGVLGHDASGSTLASLFSGPRRAFLRAMQKLRRVFCG
ncbi:hypothetical protein NP233_g10716 [Leucocoprinus birnbaumii]|uniref:Uncharacterized protein n=1 Tax=Leucocoprinus birnbaumii TaxID=56174 RepID=A0AAD5VI71_9AGAR|nr:hypothetical protein NP233_g10716 [Leucocoprinus birnbaumii]